MRHLRFWRLATAAVVARGVFSLCRRRAQYFGRNKVAIPVVSIFQILKTEHFDLYYYPERRARGAQIAARMVRALVNARLLALLRPPVAQPAGAHSLCRAIAFPPGRTRWKD